LDFELSANFLFEYKELKFSPIIEANFIPIRLSIGTFGKKYVSIQSVGPNTHMPEFGIADNDESFIKY
jgi:hypothetical protein